MVALKQYKVSFEVLCNCSDNRTIKGLLGHFERTNPQEHGKGTAYKYICSKCGQVHLTLEHYTCTLVLDINSTDKLCSHCTGLIMQLNLAEYGGA
jgi:hypothetical protein